jgi:NAD(P)-dependent dehydrogenase (short-subunit alcohol dehydrogenase family)
MLYTCIMGSSPLSQKGRGRGVLVTGCSSGIGRATSLFLADHGFTVFATVRREEDSEELKSLGKPSLIPLCPLDLRRLEHIAPLAARVERELSARGQPGLYAVINNAGAGAVSPLELLDLEAYRGELEARLLGPVALAQALLPSLRRGGGRLLWIATPALIPIPFVASIHACDYAANCLARTFALELAPWSIRSIFVRCGGINTAAPEKNALELEKEMARWPADKLALYKDVMEKEKKELAAFDLKRTDPAVVAATVLKALLAEKPRRVYRAGYLSRAGAMLDVLPQPLVDWIMSRR